MLFPFLGKPLNVISGKYSLPLKIAKKYLVKAKKMVENPPTPFLPTKKSIHFPLLAVKSSTLQEKERIVGNERNNLAPRANEWILMLFALHQPRGRGVDPFGKKRKKSSPNEKKTSPKP